MSPRIKSAGKSVLSTFRLLSQTILSLTLVAIFSKWFLPRVRRSGAKNNCIVLGNGPSLSGQIDEVRSMRSSCDVLCVNEFPNSALYEEFKPEFHLLLDPYYWEMIKGKPVANTERVMNAIITKTTWPITLVFPYEMKPIVDNCFPQLLKMSNVTMRYFNRTPVDGIKSIRYWLYRANLGIPFSQNVLVASVYFAVEMEFKIVYLFGADHSWHEQLAVRRSDNVVCLIQNHFVYEKDAEGISENENVLHPVVTPSKTRPGEQDTFLLHELYEAWARAFRGYWVVKEYAEYKSVKVINLSSKSYIDAFDRQ